MSLKKTPRIDLSDVREMVFAEDRLDWKDMAKALGVSLEGMRIARDVIYLMEEELSEDDMVAVHDASRMITYMQVKMAKELISPIMKRHFGEAGASYPSPVAARDAAKRQFMSATTALVDTMGMADGVYVPFLTEEERRQAIAEVKAGVASVHALLEAIERGGTNNG